MNPALTELLIRYGHLQKLSLEQFEEWLEKKIIVTTFDDDGNPVRRLAYPVEWGPAEETEEERKGRYRREKRFYIGPASRQPTRKRF